MVAQQGVENFISRDMAAEKLGSVFYATIDRDGIQEFLEHWRPGCFSVSPHVCRMLKAVEQAFPRRLTEKELSQQLGVSCRWIQKNCRETFGVTFCHLMRRMRVHQALLIMQKASFDNAEIAFHLKYTEESNMARDFRKELGYGPTIARRRLLERSPQELLFPR